MEYLFMNYSFGVVTVLFLSCTLNDGVWIRSLGLGAESSLANTKATVVAL